MNIFFDLTFLLIDLLCKFMIQTIFDSNHVWYFWKISTGRFGILEVRLEAKRKSSSYLPIWPTTLQSAYFNFTVTISSIDTVKRIFDQLDYLFYSFFRFLSFSFCFFLIWNRKHVGVHFFLSYTRMNCNFLKIILI